MIRKMNARIRTLSFLKKFSWIIVIILLVCIALLIVFLPKNTFVIKIGDYSLVLTLFAIIFYSYFTYVMAKDTWTPRASFVLIQHQQEPLIFIFNIKNHTKLPINCWCNLNVTIEGKEILLEGFYGGKSSFDLQPFGDAIGNFQIGDILAKANTNIESLRNKANSKNLKTLLYFKIDFEYNVINSTETFKNPIQPFYFDFEHNSMVMDF